MSGTNPNSRRGPRGSGGGGRGRGGRGGAAAGRRGRGGGRRSNRSNSNNNQQQQQTSQSNGSGENNNDVSSSSPSSLGKPQIRDEEILIAFMPYLKADDSRAIAIHEEYQSTNDSKTFLKDTREFLASKAAGGGGSSAQQQQQQQTSSSPMPPAVTSASASPSAAKLPLGATTPVHASSLTPIQSPIRQPVGHPIQSLSATPNSHMSPAATSQNSGGQYHHHHQQQQHSNHPLVPLTASSQSSPIPQANLSSFQLPSALHHQQQQQQHNSMPPPPPPPTPQQQQGIISRLPAPLGFPLNVQQQQQQNRGNGPMGMMMPPGQSQQGQQHLYPPRQQQQQQPLNMMESLELQLDRLVGGDDNDISRFLSSPTPPNPSSSQFPSLPGAIGTPRNSVVNGVGGQDAATSFLSSLMSSPSPNGNGSSMGGPSNSNNGTMGGFNQLPPGPTMHHQQQQQKMQMQQRQAQQLHHQQQMQMQQRQAQSPANVLPHTPGGIMPTQTPRSIMTPIQPSPLSEPATTPRPPSSLALSQTSTPAQLSPVLGPLSTPQQEPPKTVTKTPRKDFLQAKRMWTHTDDQPGRVTVNEVNVSDPHVVLDVRPRKELKARWMLSWKYLQQRADEMAKKTLDADGNSMDPQQSPPRSRDDNPTNRLLQNLRLGLFRRGCAENGAQASIISKSVMVSGGGGRPPFLDNQNQFVSGTVPFYSPRTPGHVVFRLYWDDEPLYTLGVGPTLHVRVMEDDYEGTIRFLLSNMKKKVNPTSLSSLHSLAQVLETTLRPPQQNSRGRQQQQQQAHDHRAGRATWGCICEARKVLDACAAEYAKTSQRLSKLATVVDDLKAELEEEEEAKQQEKEQEGGERPNEEPGGKFDDADEDALQDDEQEKDDERVQALREKTRALMSGRASCERKWRDSQLSFASILKAVVANPSMPMLLRQDMIQKMRLEYELWCPLCEEFSIIGSNGESANSAVQIANEDNEAPPQVEMWYERLNSFPSLLTTDHVRTCQESRAQMQLKTLGFVPNTRSLGEILFAGAPQAGKAPPAMNPSAVAILNQLSGAMGTIFQEVFTPEVEQRVNSQREMIRSQLEALVQQCESFPPGTKVAIFGSSANGFGTPQSDLDMCLQLPPGTSIGDDENDPNGSQAMAKLAEKMEEQAATANPASGFKIVDVDSARLTARIPIIMFRCPIVREDGTDGYMECDLSMHNPLAVMNTRFLKTYAEINPVTRVMAFVIKRWAKARDINNPARHTLSSYGYIIMLLHYLTYHQRAGNGLMSPVAGPEGKPLRQSNQPKPLLPNLLWMDGNWPKEQPGTPYREMPSRPKSMVQHPMEKVNVNTYFYRPANQAELAAVVRLFPGQDLSLAILLTSFFRYYAFEFDYKRFVVSMHSTASRGLVEREVKAELDGWRHYSAALTIEDPFETFYDVAHVLRGGYYHRIRREFAVAYSKIADVVSGNKNSVWVDANGDKKDPCSMTGMDLIDWICEPVAATATEPSS